MNIADIFMLCIIAPFAVAGIMLAALLFFITVCIIIGTVQGLKEVWNKFWNDKLTDWDEVERDQWKK